MSAFTIHRRISAPVDVVWDIVSDHGGYSTWSLFTSSELTVDGHPDRNGVGAVRKLGTWPRYSFERVIEFEAPNHLAYVIESGVPVHGYRADIDLQPTTDGSGTIMHYHAKWDSTPFGLGAPMYALMYGVLTSFAVMMDREAVKRSR